MKGKNSCNKVTKNTVIIGIACLIMILAGTAIFYNKKLISQNTLNVPNTLKNLNTYINSSSSEIASSTNVVVGDEKVKYLSDLNFITSNRWSYVSWGSLRKDLPPEGNAITLLVGGANKTFLKGVGMHANAQLTVDISELSQKYTRFISKAGIDASRGTNGNGVWFRVSVSNDGEEWTNLIEKSKVQKGDTEALDIDVNIEGYKYLRIYADNNGNESADHAVLGDAKLVVTDYVPGEWAEYDKIHPLEYYDNILKDESAENNYKNNYRTVIEREFVRKIGYDTIKNLTSLEEKKYRDVFDWILSSNENIEQIIEVGELQSASFIKVLANLYSTYKNDLDTENENRTVYLKMMIALAASYSSDHLLGPLNFGAVAPSYDYIERFEIYKYLLDNDKFMRLKTDALLGEFVVNDWVKNYHIQLLRIMMAEPIRNDEMVWLNEYTHQRGGYSFYWYAYVSPVYGRPQYQAEENREKYTTKYLLNDEKLGKYKVPYGDGAIRFWMTLENGGICWNASRGGQSMMRINGLPALGAYQVGHELYIGYYQTNEGKGYWATRYGNWSGAGTLWGGGMRSRLLFDWGNKYFADQNISGNKIASSTGYLYLGQANLNNIEAYRKSLYYNLSANSYTDNNEKLNTYFKSLEVNNLNLDTYDNIINLYKTMSVKNEGGTITSSDWASLARKIAVAYEHHPVAMFDLIKVIRPYLEGADRIEIDALERETLERARTYQSADRAEHAESVRVHATQLLNKAQEAPITFSFDGENAGQLVRNPNYENAYKYSLDGGETYVDDFKIEQKTTLSKEEIASISPENDILVKFMGLESKIFTIDITKGTMPNNLYNNDLENRIINATNILEWRLNSTDEWTSYQTEEPDLTGDKTVEVRVANTGTKIASDSVTYNFTADNQPDTEKYIPIAHLSVKSVSSEETGHGEGSVNAIDGNIKTIWHSAWDGSDTNRYIVIEIDREVFLSAIQYYPRQDAANGRIRSAKISVSTDGENWTDIITETDWANNATPKKVAFETPRKAKYVKISANTYYGDGRSFISAAMINLFEDTTTKIVPNFSFDGANAGKIFFEGETDGINWRYSLDGGNTWKVGSGDSYKLSDEEINSITEETDIKIKIISNGQEIIKTINIQKGTTPSISPYVNDWENRLINPGNTTKLEWKIENSNDGWTSYTEREPVVEGNNKILIRTIATGTFTASDSIEYSFNEDTDTEERKYISVKHLSIHYVSSQATGSGQNGNAIYAIDGDDRTRWHSNWSGADREKIMIIKLDEPKYLTALEYMPVAGGNGKIESAQILVSMDGENWVEVVPETNWTYANTNDVTDKAVDFTATKGQYIKIVGKRTQSASSSASFIASRMFRLYEDTTKAEEPEPVTPTAELEYSPKPEDPNAKINQNVVVRLVNPSTEIRVTNNNGSTEYTFTENGAFTFEFEDANGNKGMTTARVTWIDKVPPVGTISYNINEATNQNVRATITFDKQNVRITNNNGENTYTFTENGAFTFEFIGPSGNTGTATARVNWIDRTAPVATIEYSTTNKTNQPVVATIKFNEQNVRITNNEGRNTYTFDESGEFTFEYIDQAGNTGSAKAIVNWINKTIPRATITYNPPYTSGTMTNKDVVATISFDREDVVVEGGNTHTFTSNGSYTFKFTGPYGNAGEATANVDWIDKVAPKATITYSTLKATNQPVVATIAFDKQNVRITNNNGANTYTFNDNGEFEFEFVGPSGNTGSAIAKVTWIDKNAPVATITYDITEKTNQNVTATITFDKDDVTIRNNGGKNTYTFTENGEFEFTFVGPAGNVGSAIAKVTWIDKDALIPLIRYSITDITNQDVTATITFNKDNVTIQNNGGKNTHTFTENGTFDFYYVDNAGNTGMKTAVVSWIDKTAPVATITYSRTNPTNQNVLATITFNEENVRMRNNDGETTYLFTENGEFTFLYTDEAGNNGAATAKVSWIDRELPKATVTYSTKALTNQDVVATIKFDKENVTITNNEGKNTYTFTDNNEFTFDFVDEAGNIGTETAIVNWIDKVIPTAEIEYNITEPTNKNVIAKLVNPSEEITITNNMGKDTYTFEKNGKFIFEIVDKVGNKGKVEAEVTWIDPDLDNKFEFELKKYELDGKYICGIRPGIDGENTTTVKEFKTNIETNQELEFVKDEKVLGDNDIITTGTILKVGEKVEYTLVVRGDMNGNGEITIDDLAKLKLHYLELKLLDGAYLKAADIDVDKEITTNDIAQIKLMLLGLMETE